MDESRSFAESSGKYFVLWGLITGAGMFGTWLIASRYIPVDQLWIWGLWIGLLALGVGLGMGLERADKRAPVRHYVNTQIGHVWFALGIANMLLFFVGQYFNIVKPLAIPSIAAVLLGVGMYLTGVLAKLDWLRNLCVAWWLAAVAMMIVPGRDAFLIYAVLILVFFVIPGLRLQRLVRAVRA